VKPEIGFGLSFNLDSDENFAALGKLNGVTGEI